MEKDFEKKHHFFEENYWWFRARRDMILDLIEKRPKNSEILDLGCATGATMEFLQKNGFTNVAGIDNSPEAIEICKNKGLNAILADASEFNSKQNGFDVIIMADVLEHIKDDEGVLRGCKNLLKAGGIIIVTVPAFAWLWGKNDEENLHYKRYTRLGLSDLLKKIGLNPIKISYWNFILFLPIAMMIFLSNISKSNPRFFSNSFLNNFLTGLMKIENRFFRMFNLPVGISVIAVATKDNL